MKKYPPTTHHKLLRCNKHIFVAYCLCLLVLLTFSNRNYAKDDQWQLKKSKDGIDIFTKATHGSPFKTVQGKTVVKAGLVQLVSFLQDEQLNTQWVPYSGGAKVLSQVSPQTSIVHFKVTSSWPFKNRDAVAVFEITQDQDSLELIIHISNSPDYIPKQKSTIRMPSYSGFWRLTPVSNQETKITYQNHVDPGGNLPGWIANPFAVDATWQALANLKAQVKSYHKIPARLDFLKELEKPLKRNNNHGH